MAKKYSFDYCPECGTRIRLRSPRLGQQIQCRECDTILEVVGLSPLELDWSFDEGYDNELDFSKTRYSGNNQYGDYEYPSAYDD